MRVALVSPYSYGYPGGVARHVEALADELRARGLDTTLLAPHDPDDRLTRLLHGGRPPQRRPRPADFVPLGRTVAVRANGARSNLGCTLEGIGRLSGELRRGRFDVVHVHEPNAPLASWCAVELARSPLVGTFHAHSTSRLVNVTAANLVGARRLYNKLAVRIAVSEAARWTAERFYGGRYRVVPNGVDATAGGLGVALPRPLAPAGSETGACGRPLRLLYLGRAEERKGLPVLLRAFEALRAGGTDVELTIAGPEPDEVRALVPSDGGVGLAGRVTEAEKWRLLREADLMCAPSLGGESFGMVLAEALAAGTPAVCSDIAGYREIVRDGVEGALVAPGRPDELAAAVRALARDDARREAMAAAARAGAQRFAWPGVADEVIAAYEEAAALPAPAGRRARMGARLGLVPADRRSAAPAGPSHALPARARVDASRRPGSRGRGAVAGALGLAVTAALAGALLLADDRPASIADALTHAGPAWALAAVVLMGVAPLARAEAWHALLRGALGPSLAPRRADTARATLIGVLMSASLPARLGELSRALVVSGRLGRLRERLPLVAGTIVSQTVLNLGALAVLGSVVLATAAPGTGSASRLALLTIVPGASLVLAAAGTALVRARGDAPERSRRAAVAAGFARLRTGVAALARPSTGVHAGAAQLVAWLLQLLACLALLAGFGLAERTGLGGAAAVLFAVNVAAALPALPSNVGVFQAACVAVLAAYGVDGVDALAFGLSLQALELGVAAALGAPVLMREGVGWRDMRRHALEAASLELTAPVPAPRRAHAGSA